MEKQPGYTYLYTFGSDYSQFKFEPNEDAPQTRTEHAGRSYHSAPMPNGNLQIINNSDERITIPVKDGNPNFADSTITGADKVAKKLMVGGENGPAANNVDPIILSMGYVPGLSAPHVRDFRKAAAATPLATPDAAPTAQPAPVALPAAAPLATRDVAVKTATPLTRASPPPPAAAAAAPVKTVADRVFQGVGPIGGAYAIPPEGFKVLNQPAAPAATSPPPPVAPPEKLPILAQIPPGADPLKTLPQDPKLAPLPAAAAPPASGPVASDPAKPVKVDPLKVDDFGVGKTGLSRKDQDAINDRAKQIADELNAKRGPDRKLHSHLELKITGTADNTKYAHPPKGKKSDEQNTALADDRSKAMEVELRKDLKKYGVSDDELKDIKVTHETKINQTGPSARSASLEGTIAPDTAEAAKPVGKPTPLPQQRHSTPPKQAERKPPLGFGHST